MPSAWAQSPKPAVHDQLLPVLESWGLPAATADVIAFVLALIVVTFLHLVVGEIAPKSWAIAHPERSAILLALPMRAFMTVTRPLLIGLNGSANRCARGRRTARRRSRAGHTPAALRELVNHSAKGGALDRDRRDQLLTAMELDTAALRTLVQPHAELSGVSVTDRVDDIRGVAQSLVTFAWSCGAAPTRPAWFTSATPSAPTPAPPPRTSCDPC